MATDGTAVSAGNTPPSSDSGIQWDGDRMFNIYIYDYCLKRGFMKTASELMQEAQIPPQSQPPINAKQGLLFEWWSVFWVLFTAKTNGHGSEDAVLYTQHQAHMQSVAQKAQRSAAQQGQTQQRFANGVRPPGAPGPQPNGVGPPPHPQAQAGALPNGGTPSSIPFPGNAPQPNGIAGASTGPSGPAPPPPGQGPPQSMLNHQRQGVPQRAVNGMTFQSPTMAHSPPNHPTGAGSQPNNPMGSIGPVGANQPLTRGGMLPPNPQGSQQTPQPAFQALVGRSPSNPGSPAQNNLTHPSPSMQHRQPPGMNPMSPEVLANEMMRIPPPTLAKLKSDLGMGDKAPEAFTLEEKQQIVNAFRRQQMKPPNMAGPSTMPMGQPGGAIPPPSGLRNPPMAPNAQHAPQPPPGQNAQQRTKRASTSPGQDNEQLPRNDSSPPDRKRVRRSPANEPAQPPMAGIYPPQAPQGQPGGPMQPPPPMHGGNMVRGGMPMQAFAGQPMMGNPMLAQHMPPMNPMNPMNPAMSPAMMSVQTPPGMHQKVAVRRAPPDPQYRQAMQSIHKPPHLVQPGHPGGVPSPSADGQGVPNMQGGPPPGSRMQQGKPMGGSMMPPPPSPAMAPKTPGGPPKVDDGNVRIDASPQNNAAGIGGPPPPGMQGGPQQVPTSAPQTPSAPPPSSIPNPAGAGAPQQQPPSMAQQQQQQQQQQQPPQPQPTPTPLDGGPLDPTFNIDFGVNEFDPTLFSSDGLNFERDFAEWFTPNPT